jgi:hypothetical protein
MQKYQYLPHGKLGTHHIGKPLKLVLKNGKTIYGTISKVRNNGIVFIPINANAVKNKNARSQWFFPFLFFPIFIPFLFFIPFLICI